MPSFKQELLKAKSGDKEAQYQIGTAFENGTGVEKDYQEALKWYSLSAKQGLSKAYNHIGNLYFFGNGVTKNEKEAIKNYKKAVELNDKDAISQFNLGRAYFFGYGTKKNETLGLEHIEKSAKNGFSTAQYFLANQYEEGKVLKLNINEAIKWYKEATLNGGLHSYVKLLSIFEDLKKPEDLFLWANKNIKLMSKNSKMFFGIASYYFGWGTEQDYKKAYDLILPVAIIKNKDTLTKFHAGIAQFFIGKMYLKGMGVKKNINEGVKWLKKAANNENTLAYEELGSFFMGQNKKESFNWFKKASEKGSDKSLLTVAILILLDKKSDKKIQISAIKDIEKVMALPLDIQRKKNLEKYWEILSSIFDLKGDKNQASKYLKHADSLGSKKTLSYLPKDNQSAKIIDKSKEIKSTKPKSNVINLEDFASSKNTFKEEEQVQISDLEFLNSVKEMFKKELQEIAERHVSSLSSFNTVNTTPEFDIDFIHQREGQFLEKKSTFLYNIHSKKQDDAITLAFMKSIAGMLNFQGGGKGGTIILGVSDENEILGIENDIKTIPKANKAAQLEKKLDAFELYLREKIENYINSIDIFDIKIEEKKFEDKHVCRLILKKFDEGDYSPRPAIVKSPEGEKFFIRNGNRTKELNTSESMEYLRKYFQK